MNPLPDQRLSILLGSDENFPREKARARIMRRPADVHNARRYRYSVIARERSVR